MTAEITVLPTRLPAPTPDEPIPTLAGTPGMKLLRSAAARRLPEVLNPQEQAEVRKTAQAIFASLTPASLEDVRNQLEGLALFFPQLRRTPEEQRVWVHTWMEDLRDMPRDLLADACRQWRLQPFPKGEARFPTPGQLIAMADKVLNHRKALAIRARHALEAFDHASAA